MLFSSYSEKLPEYLRKYIPQWAINNWIINFIISGNLKNTSYAYVYFRRKRERGREKWQKEMRDRKWVNIYSWETYDVMSLNKFNILPSVIQNRKKSVNKLCKVIKIFVPFLTGAHNFWKINVLKWISNAFKSFLSE